jgi:hypothetical protein
MHRGLIGSSRSPIYYNAVTFVAPPAVVEAWLANNMRGAATPAASEGQGEYDVAHVTKSIRAALAAAVLAVGAATPVVRLPAQAETAKANPVDILFERKHLANVDVGSDLSYRFQRSVSHPDVLGQPFSDDIHVQVKKVGSDGSRDVVVKVFSGDRAREPQPIDGITGNPILVVFLDRSVASYMSVAGGSLPYLRDKFRSALRDKATVEPVKVMLGEKTVDAQRVTVTPYKGDLNAARMRGFENSTFSIVVSDLVPGQFVELLATYENTDAAAPRLEERTQMIGTQVVP